MHYRRPMRGFTPQAIANARKRYEDTDEPQSSIAADLGVHPRSLSRIAEARGWKRRLPPRHRQPRGFTAAAIANARKRYEETDEALDSIAADFGVTRKTLDRLAKDQGWLLRKDRPPRELSSAARLALEAERAVRAKIEGGEAGVDQGAAGEGNALSVAERLERAAENELSGVELMRALGGPHPPTTADAERTARTLASLTDTLYRVKRLRDPESKATGSYDFDDMPQDIDEFRHALAERIEAFVRSHPDAAVSATGESANTESHEQ